MAKPLPTAERVRELLDYDPATGTFTWRVRCGRQAAGKPAGCVGPNGYVLVSIDGTLLTAHRLVWFLETGEWPESDIDHRDLDTAHNQIDNLRLATRAQNNANCLPHKNNTSGFKGVHWDKKNEKWVAQITVNRKNRKIGRFLRIEDALAAYAGAAKAAWGDYARV